MRISVLGFALFGSFIAPMEAGAQQRVTAAELTKNVANLLGHTLRLERLGCFVSDNDTLKCTTYSGVYIVPRDVVPASLNARIRANCGGLAETETDPSCLFDGVFTPSSMERGRGSVTHGDQSVESDVLILFSPPISLTTHR